MTEDTGAPVPDPWIGGADRPVHGRVRRAIEPIIQAQGCTLVGVELGREGHRAVLWVYADKDGGITLDDCSRISHEISPALDVDDPMPEPYNLHVSSPGLDRPLMRASDFTTYVGREAVVQLSEPHEGRRKYTGVLGALVDDAVTMVCTDGDHLVPLSKILKARLKYDPPTPGAKR
ncbi:MAG: ribosome maturation factor RimP [Bradymonadia bacterium]|jgi:ribosome maturation factor RimP